MRRRADTGPEGLAPYSALLRAGFGQPVCLHTAGALLPHHFTLTHLIGGRYVSVPLSVGSPRLGVTQRPALWSSDFPQPPRRRPRTLGPLRHHCSTLTTDLCRATGLLWILLVAAGRSRPLLGISHAPAPRSISADAEPAPMKDDTARTMVEGGCSIHRYVLPYAPDALDLGVVPILSASPGSPEHGLARNAEQVVRSALPNRGSG